MKKQLAYWSTVFVVVFAIIIALERKKNRREERRDTVVMSSTTVFNVEHYVRSNLSQEDVVPGLWPALVFVQNKDARHEVFHLVGGVFRVDGTEPRILTSEHALAGDMKGEFSLRVEVLRGPLQGQSFYCQSVISTGSDLAEKGDVLILKLGTTRAFLKPYSAFVTTPTDSKLTFGVPMFNQKPLGRIRSIISGKIIPVAGISNYEGSNAPFLIGDYAAYPGESGTPCIDENGWVWVAHGRSVEQQERQMMADCHQATGIRMNVGVTMFSGPIIIKDTKIMRINFNRLTTPQTGK